MTWRPLVPEERRAEVAAIVREIVEAIDAAPSADDPVARPLLRVYAAQGDVVPDPDDASGAALSDAVTALPEARTMGLHGGVTGTAWLVAHMASGESADALCEHVDAALRDRLAAWRGDYDLIGGLVGFGVYALERGDAGQAIAARVVELLAERSQPWRGGLGWHTTPLLLPPHQREVAPDGYWNLGLAHGIPGAIALLARCVALDVAGARARELLDGGVAALLAAEPANPGGRYPGWYAGAPDGDAAAPRHENRRRLAWCYNDLGVALALLSAAQATGDAAWRDEAIALAHGCASRSLDEAAVLDTGLCHGAAGAAHLFNRLWQATDDDAFARAGMRWFERTLEMRSELPLAGFPARAVTDKVERWVPDGSLLNGAAGTALVLHALITDAEPTWDRVILTDLALAGEPPGGAG